MIRITTTTALVTLMAAPVMADVTAPQVWSQLTTLYQTMGLKFDATQTRDGHTTTISDLKLSAKFPFEMGSVTITTTGLDLVENDDGTVALNFPEHIPLAMALTLPNDMFVTAKIDYDLTGYNAVASGNPDDMTITYAMEKATMRLVDLTLPSDIDAEFEMTMMMENFTGASTYKTNDMLLISQHTTGGAMEIEGSFSDPTPNSPEPDATFSMRLKDMDNISKLALPLTGIDLMNLSDHLRDGLSVQYTSKIGATATSNTITSMGQIVADQKTFAETGNSALSVARDGLQFDSSYANYTIDYVMEHMPARLRARFAKVGGTLKMPLLKSDAQQDFKFTQIIDSMVIGEDLWALFDPTSKLSRDPATLTVDISGKGHLFVDLLDFTALQEAAQAGEKIAEPTALTINALDLSAIGASVTGRGAFSFDNDDYETFDGMPAPTGNAKLHFAGLNTVIDKFIDIGLMESGQALPIRMGLGMFTVLGDSKDTLVSDIVITPDGHVSANGKRLK